MTSFPNRLFACLVAVWMLSGEAVVAQDTTDTPAPAPDSVQADTLTPPADFATAAPSDSTSAADSMTFADADSAASANPSVTVEVTGLKNQEGKLLVALFDDPEDFPSDSEDAPMRDAVPIDGETMQVTFDDVPAGTYAVAIIHDENDNGELDTNFFGVPKEGIGFSRGATAGTFGPPDFSEADFAVTEEDVMERIEVNY